MTKNGCIVKVNMLGEDSMEENMIEKMKLDHIDRYRNALIETVHNNTSALIEDIVSFIDKPPLDSMDFVQNIFYSMAKKNKVIINSEELEIVLKEYRKELLQSCDMVQMMRIHELTNRIKAFDFSQYEVFEFYKKDFNELNKNLRKVLKEKMTSSYENQILNRILLVFQGELNEEQEKSIIQDITKYMKNIYQKQILENFDIKVLVKDTTLMNSIKEQGERYSFTLKNSRLFQDLMS